MSRICNRISTTSLGAVLLAGAGAAGCSSATPTGSSPFVDAGSNDAGVSVMLSSPDGGGALESFVSPPDPGPGAFYVTISGESNALTGYPFPPQDFQNDTYMYDGWQIQILAYIVNVDHVTLWSNPDHDPTNQGDLSGMTQIAHLDGPFVVDLHKRDPGDLVGQGGGGELAKPIGVIANQNDNGGAAFDTSGGTPYGFGFHTVAATYGGYNVNLDASEAQYFDLMVQRGYSVLYVGTATWKGDDSSNPYTCTQTNAGNGVDEGADAGDAGPSDGGYDFTKLPPTMTFVFGFSTPTSYVNCQNGSAHGMANPGEDYPRGVVASSSQSAIAQVTVHMDHPFWESFAEDSPVHWDQIAAQYVGVDGGPTGPEAQIEDLVGVGFHPFTDHVGAPLPWRNCAGPNYTPPGAGQMFFSTLSVPIDPNGTCTGTPGQDYTLDDCPAIRDYYDYIRFTQSTQGHLNSQGLCFIDRQYPAPAGGS